jgi:hypothetical protein
VWTGSHASLSCEFLAVRGRGGFQFDALERTASHRSGLPLTDVRVRIRVYIQNSVAAPRGSLETWKQTFAAKMCFA